MKKIPELIRLTDSRYRQIVAAGQLIEKNRNGREGKGKGIPPVAHLLQGRLQAGSGEHEGIQ